MKIPLKIFRKIEKPLIFFGFVIERREEVDHFGFTIIIMPPFFGKYHQKYFKIYYDEIDKI